ncbi:hypothetical protein ACFX13_011542 [Malus domestica]
MPSTPQCSATYHYYHQPGDQKYTQYSTIIRQLAAITTNQTEPLFYKKDSLTVNATSRVNQGNISHEPRSLAACVTSS